MGQGEEGVLPQIMSAGQDTQQIVGAGVHLFIAPFQDLDYAAGDGG